MTTYRLMDGQAGRPGNGPATGTAFAGALVVGCAFGVTSGSKWFEGYWWWVPTTNGDTAAGQKFALWQVNGTSGGTLIPGSVVTAGALTAGAWNYVPLSTPIQLTPYGIAPAMTAGAVYMAATGKTFTSGFPETKNQFGAGDPFAAGITNGPLTAFSGPTGSLPAGGTSAWSPQMAFTTGTADPSAAMPSQADSDANLWLDVQVSDTESVAASYRCFPNMPDFVVPGTGPQSLAYTLGLEFTLSKACNLTRIWHYSPPGVTVLPTRCAIWDVTGKATVAGTDKTSPTWSGAAGSGWVSCDYSSSGVTLLAGKHYKVSTFTSDNTDPWFLATAGYWGGSPGPFSSGIAQGPLTVLGNSASTEGQDSWNQGTTWTYPATGNITNGADSPEFDGIDVEVTPVPSGPWRLWPSTNGPATAASYTGNFISGTAFAVKGGGKWFEGYWWWVAPTTQSTAPVKCALWTTKGAYPGFVVPGSVVTSGTLTAGQWNWIPLPEPVQLAPTLDVNNTENGSAYIAAIGVNGNFPDTNGYWGQGGPGSNGIANGPLFAYSCGNTTGATNQAPYGLAQGLFTTGGSDPETTMPNEQSTVDNFWVDVQVTDVAPAGYTGPYRLYPNKADANNVVSGDSAVNYTIATEVHLSQKCTLNAIWYYRPNTATTMATRCDVWDITTGLSVASITSPTWLGTDGSAFVSGSGASGGIGTWAQAKFPAGVTLPAGQYRVSVYNANGTSDVDWSPKDASSDYFGETYPGAGASGIEWGVIFAPNWASASPGYLYGGVSTNNPAYSNGTTPHAQPVFGQGASGEVVFPQLNAPVGTPADQTQNYWVDLEVTPVGAPSSGLLMATYL